MLHGAAAAAEAGEAMPAEEGACGSGVACSCHDSAAATHGVGTPWHGMACLASSLPNRKPRHGRGAGGAGGGGAAPLGRSLLKLPRLACLLCWTRQVPGAPREGGRPARWLAAAAGSPAGGPGRLMRLSSAEASERGKCGCSAWPPPLMSGARPAQARLWRLEGASQSASDALPAHYMPPRLPRIISAVQIRPCLWYI